MRKKYPLLKLFTLLLLVCASPAIALAGEGEIKKANVLEISQDGRSVTGTIKGPGGEPLVGVTVVDANDPTKGAVSDVNGNFRINNVAPGTELVVSSVGYLKQTVTAQSGTLNVVMQTDLQNLDEVVVVGYSSTTKRSLISAVAQVKSEDLATLPIANMTKGLAGRAPGLIVHQSGGGINNQATISIRGGSTPLVVIDGIIRDYQDFVQMPSEDIEALSILKDASATAVYGSRAANGIIQITTKKGKEGKPYIEYNFNMSFATPANWKQPMNSWDRAYYTDVSKANDGYAAVYGPDRIQIMKDGSDPVMNNNTNWRKATLRGYAPQQMHSVRMTGGTEINQYYFSFSHLDQESMFRNDNYNQKRNNYRLSNSTLIKDIGLRVTATIDGYLREETEPHTSTGNSIWGIFSHIQNTSPLIPAYNKYGLTYAAAETPVSETAKDVGYALTNQKVVNGNLNLEWSVPYVDGLKIKANGNYRYNGDTKKSWRKDAAKYDWDSMDAKYDAMPRLTHETWNNYRWTYNFFAEYANTFGKHTVGATIGYEETYGYNKYYSLSRENYLFPIDQIKIGPEDTQKNGGSESESGRAGMVTQLKYNYDNRYFVDFGLRYDGSDQFPKDNRWGTFFSVAGAWSITDEAFMKNVVQRNIFNQLKLRASYGEVGLDNWSDPYGLGRFAYMPSYSLNNAGYVINGQYYATFSEGAIPSTAIKWFTTYQTNIALDFASLGNRLYGGVDYFYTKTKGFLFAPNAIDVGYTDPLGMSLPKVSTDGEERKEGFDFHLGWRDSYNGFTYDVSMNMTKFDKLWAFQPAEGVADVMNPYRRSSQQKGYHGNMYRNMGYYTDAADVYNSVQRTESTNLRPGDIKYWDFNGDGQLDGNDQIRSGKNSFPRANYGINIKLGYKGAFLNMLFQGATRFDMYLQDRVRGGGSDMPVIYSFQTNYWTPENTNARYPRLLSSSGYNGGNNYVTSDFWLVNGAYFRMKDIAVGYDFKRLVNVNWLSKMSLAFSAQNVFTISKATKYGLDPENSNTNNYGYPNERTYAISLSIGF